MRIDKFLKVSRIVKRRTVANQLCDHGFVAINGRTVKAGQEVIAGDRIEVRIGQRTVSYEVLSVADNVPARDAGTLYRIIGGDQ